MSVTNTTVFANNLMFHQQPLFWAGTMEGNDLYKRIRDKSSKGVKADGGYFYVKETAFTRLGYGMRPIATEGGVLPAHRPDTPVVPTWGLVSHAYKIRISGPAYEAGNIISEVDITSATMQAAQRSIAHFLAYDLRGSVFGHMARAVGAGAGATALVVDDASPFRAGMAIDVFSALSGGTQKLDGVTINAVNLATNTLTLATASTWADGDYVFYDDSRGAMQNGIAGLLADTNARTISNYIVTPGVASYAGLTRATTANWTSFAANFNGGTFDIKYVEKFLSDCAAFQHRSKGPAFTAIYAAPSTVATLLSLVPYQRMLGEGTKIAYGTTGSVYIQSPFVENGRLEVIPVLDWWKKSLWFINEKDLKLRWPVEPGWVKVNGEILMPNQLEYTGYDTYTAVWITRWALIGHPIEHALYYNIPEIS